MTIKYENYLNSIIAIAKHAGQAILQIYNKSANYKVQFKADNSPLTEADLIANDIINADLHDLIPDIPILSEEGSAISYAKRSKWQTYWLVDPLDGTNEFISHSGEFTVNIALIENHRPVLGVSYAPARQTCYFACSGKGAFMEDVTGKIKALHTKSIQNDTIKVVVSRNIGIEVLQPFLDHLDNSEIIYFGGSLKLCLVAEGAVDIYPRLGSNCEWDTAAGQCIVEEAGGIVVGLDFKPLQYNTKDSLYNPRFLVIADPSYNWQDYLRFLRN